jgi:hypothetical protein
MTPQLKRKLLKTLIKNSYDRFLTAEQLQVDVALFDTEEFMEYVKSSVISLTKSDISQMIINEMNELNEVTIDEVSYHRVKQKYVDQLIGLIEEGNDNQQYDIEI